jgi:tRNA(Ile)-lysidine synthase
MTPLPDKLCWPLFAPGDRVLVAVSGGPDSLCLLHALWSEREARGLGGVEAAHLDHGLRGGESAGEAAWVAAWCAARGIPCHVGRADVAGLARERKRSKQEAARAARYAFLKKTAAQIGATKIATGHTRDDQVETVLMNVLRGTGLDGLRGIPVRRGLFVRPLLDVSRAEIEDYCAAHGLEPRRDPSNLSPDAYTRNRVRLELLPLLAREYNPAVAEALLRLSKIAGRDVDYLQTQADAALTEATWERDVFRLVLNRPTLTGLHPALLRHVLRRAIASLRGTGEGITYDHVEQACRAVADPAPKPFLLNLPYPLCTVRVVDATLTLTLANVPASLADVSVSLPVPGTAVLPGTDWTVRASSDALPDAVMLDADTVSSDALTLRNWRQGDRVDPLGMGGRHKKVGDIFTDAKVSRAERHRVPIIADTHGIVWVVGHCVAERVRVTPATRRRLYLVAEHNPEEPLPARSSPPSPTGRG